MSKKHHSVRRTVHSRGIVGRRLSDERGIAMVITLFVVVLVTILVLEYHFDAKIETDLAVNYARDVQAYYLALAGVNFARALLRQDGQQVDGPYDMWHRLSLVPVCISPQQMLALAEGDSSTAPFFGGLQEEGEMGLEDGQTEQGCVELRVIDEQGKLPVNALMPVQQDEGPDPTWLAIFEEFFVSRELEPGILDALVDWIDANDVPSGVGGAETSYYAGLETPYRAPNRPMRTPGELRLVRGMDAPMLRALSSEGLIPEEQREKMLDVDVSGNRYLTTFGSVDDAKVNINTANEYVLEALLLGVQGGSAGVGALVTEIIAMRQEEPFATVSDVSQLIPDSGVQSRLEEVADVKSVYFRVESVGRVDVVEKRAVVVFKRGGQDGLTPLYFKVE